MKIRWKKVLYFVFLLGSMLGFKNAVGQNDSIQNKNIESNLSENSFQIIGVVRDSSDKSPLAFCQIILVNKYKKNSIVITTDINGFFESKAIPNGVYSLKASYVGYQTIVIDSISEKSNKKYEISLSPVEYDMDTIIISCYYKSPINDLRNTTNSETLDSDDIKNMPIRR